MALREDFISKIVTCEWLSRCGEHDDFSFDVEYVKSTQQIDKNINSIRWENLCLEMHGNFTAYLCKNYCKEYNEKWNQEVRFIKEKYISVISNDVIRALSKTGVPISALDDIRANIISIFMLEYYSEFYSCDFYDHLLEVYLAGHLPCGWVGKYPKGKLLIY